MYMDVCMHIVVEKNEPISNVYSIDLFTKCKKNNKKQHKEKQLNSIHEEKVYKSSIEKMSYTLNKRS